MQRVALAFGVFLIVLGLTYFVYPTPYIIDRVGTDFVRINRFSGVKEYATDHGWQTMDQMVASKLQEDQKTLRAYLDQKSVSSYRLDSSGLTVSTKDGSSWLVCANQFSKPFVQMLVADGIPDGTTRDANFK